MKHVDTGTPATREARREEDWLIDAITRQLHGQRCTARRHRVLVCEQDPTVRRIDQPVHAARVLWEHTLATTEKESQPTIARAPEHGWRMVCLLTNAALFPEFPAAGTIDRDQP